MCRPRSAWRRARSSPNPRSQEQPLPQRRRARGTDVLSPSYRVLSRSSRALEGRWRSLTHLERPARSTTSTRIRHRIVRRPSRTMTEEIRADAGGLGVAAATMAVALDQTGLRMSTAVAAAGSLHAFETAAGLTFGLSGWLVLWLLPATAGVRGIAP